MTDASNGGNGGSAPNAEAAGTPEGATTPDVAPEGSVASTKVREAISLIKQHPLGTVAAVAAATVLWEFELALGIFAGLGATALLATESGPETRRRVYAKGKWALARARSAIPQRPPKATEAAEAPPAPPPA